MSGVSSDVRGLGGAMGVSLVASSDGRGLGGAMGVVLVTSGLGGAMGVSLVASSDVRGLGVAMGVMPEAWEVTSEEQWVCLVTLEDWEGQWV